MGDAPRSQFDFPLQKRGPLSSRLNEASHDHDIQAQPDYSVSDDMGGPCNSVIADQVVVHRIDSFGLRALGMRASDRSFGHCTCGLVGYDRPPLVYFPWRLRWSMRAIRWLSLSLFLGSLIGTAGIIVWQWLVWLPQSGAWSKDYFWQRCGFVVATSVDWPLIPMTVVSIVLWMNTGIRFWYGRFR
ncbi:MAG TPA: hypothetical protein PKD64_17895 [Pirellulaceae bacterium]|nr:hypothetical protein [Pirellulaceae bacterium]HMO94062.1 hypothetical protein [Pirellulaceae bacterium]HMP70932.1 hypothetical protein [Pirellulaceae bacterium]